MTKNVFLIRHGETQANIRREIQGQSGYSPLTTSGRTQVEEVTSFLKTQLSNDAHIWSSDLGRSKDTANLIHTGLNSSPPIFLSQLRQRNWGHAEGKRYNASRGAFFKIVSKVSDSEKRNVLAIVIGDDPFGVEESRSYPYLRTISRFGSGVDAIDVYNLWHKRNITVTHTQKQNADSVAEFSVAMIILMLRNLPVHMFELRESGPWRAGQIGHELQNATIGIIGCGSTGFQTAKRLYQLGATVQVWNRTWPPEGIEASDLSLFHHNEDIRSLASTSDVISLHVALGPETHHLLNESLFQEISKSARHPAIVNTSRCDVIDEEALLNALNQGVISSAALDVWSLEKEQTNDTVLALRCHPNVIATPHIAGYSVEARRNMAMQCAQNVVCLVEGRGEEVQEHIIEVW